MSKPGSAAFRVVINEALAAGERGANGSLILSQARAAALLIARANVPPQNDQDIDPATIEGHAACLRLTAGTPALSVGDLAVKLALVVQNILSETQQVLDAEFALAASALSDAVLLQYAPLDGGEGAGAALEALAALSTPPVRG